MATCVRSSRRGAFALFVAIGVTACSGGEFGSKSGLIDEPKDSGTPPSGGGAGGASTSAAGGRSPAASGGAPGTGGSVAGATGSDGGVTSSGGMSSSGGASSSGGSAGANGSGGGGPTGTIQLVTSYDRACNTDADCVLVVEGDVCGCPACHTASIAATAQTAWDADRKRIYCPTYGAPTSCPAIACVAMLPACAGGLCAARPQRIIDGASYATSCRTDTDCHLVYTGEVCGVCRCAVAAVNGTGFAQYQQDISGVECTPGPSPCDCAAPTATSCKLPTTPDLGTCVVGP